MSCFNAFLLVLCAALQEFFFNEQRKGRQQTREQALFGSFADDSDDDDDGRRGRKRKKEDLSKPVAFVSHGVTGSSTDKEKDVEKVEHQVQDGGSSGQGLGFSRGGLGFTPAQGPEEEDQEVEIADLPTSFGQRYPQLPLKNHIWSLCYFPPAE